MITQERLHELFEYREDGNLLWKIRLSNISKIGDAAGYVNSMNYRRVQLEGKKYVIHRLIFLYHHGYLTDGMEIDHIDGNPKNNRIENLREVTKSQNRMNAKKSLNNTSGTKGVYLDRGKWRSVITVNRKVIELGRYTTKEEAITVAKEAREKYHGEYARHE